MGNSWPSLCGSLRTCKIDSDCEEVSCCDNNSCCPIHIILRKARSSTEFTPLVRQKWGDEDDIATARQNKLLHYQTINDI
jgi:hypothetical protein